MESSALLGNVSCLVAACCWAVAVTFFRRPIALFGAQAVNLGKNSIAALLLGLTALFTGQLGSLLGASPTAVGLIAASGLVGMTLGDTALFVAVAHLGAHRALLLQTLAPVFAALLAFLLRGELLSTQQLAGAAVVLLGIIVVVSQRKPKDERGAAKTSSLDIVGLLAGLLAAFGQGAGVVLAKEAMDEIPFLAAGTVRLTTAAFGLIVVMLLLRNGRGITALCNVAALKKIAGPAFLGTYVAILLMMLGISLAPASLAAVLLATSPIFSLFVDAKVEKTPISLWGVVGTLLAVAGVGLIATA